MEGYCGPSEDVINDQTRFLDEDGHQRQGGLRKRHRWFGGLGNGSSISCQKTFPQLGNVLAEPVRQINSGLHMERGVNAGAGAG